MAAQVRGERKGPRMIKEILRLHDLGIGKERIGNTLGISKNTVKKYLREHIEQSESGGPRNLKQAAIYEATWSHLVAWDNVKQATDKGCTLLHYWEDKIKVAEKRELAIVPYVSFWREFKRKFPEIPLDFHKQHPPGERCEVDYKGRTAALGYIDRSTREFVTCRLFGAILCFSQKLFVKATRTEKQPDLLGSLSESYEYFGGVAHTTAFDNAKAAVNRAHRYDPDLNPEFAMFCEHYGTAPLAMRPRKPKDKNLIENALGVFWRWIRYKMREQTFYSLGELNDFLKKQLEVFNNRVQRKYGASREEKFEAGERENLLTLPATAYSVGTWKKAKLHPDCHIQVGYNFYSAPYHLRGEQLDVRIAAGIIEVFHKLERVALHLAISSNQLGRYLTKDAHLPLAHQAIKEFTPQKALNDAEEIGVATFEVVKRLIEESIHPLRYLRRVQGILRLANRYSKSSLEKACEIILNIGTREPKLSDLEDIVKNNNLQNPSSSPTIKRSPNPNLRGQDSWSKNLN